MLINAMIMILYIRSSSRTKLAEEDYRGNYLQMDGLYVCEQMYIIDEMTHICEIIMCKRVLDTFTSTY